MLLLKKWFYNWKISICQFTLMLFLSCFFFSCKRSNSHFKRDFDPKLIQTLNKLERKYANKKVRINTWNKKEGIYQDIVVLDEENQPTKQTLTIGDSVAFAGIDVNKADGICAKIILKDKVNGYISYYNIEEFEPATVLDPDLKY